MKKDKSTLLLLLGVLGCSIIGCSDDRRIVLTDQEKELVDSLYKRKLPSLREQMDSICDEQNAKYFRYFSDSLKTTYLNDIHEIQDYLEYGEE